MEDVLQSIIKDATGKQQQNIKQAAQIAYGKKMLFRTFIFQKKSMPNE